MRDNFRRRILAWLCSSAITPIFDCGRVVAAFWLVPLAGVLVSLNLKGTLSMTRQVHAGTFLLLQIIRIRDANGGQGVPILPLLNMNHLAQG